MRYFLSLFYPVSKACVFHITIHCSHAQVLDSPMWPGPTMLDSTVLEHPLALGTRSSSTSTPWLTLPCRPGLLPFNCTCHSA